MEPTKNCKPSTILIDDETLQEEFTEEDLQAMSPSLEEIRKLLYPTTIIIEELGRQTDNVKSCASDKKSQGQDTSADTTKHPMKSEKKSCKRLAFMATPKKQLRVTSIDSDSGRPTAFEQNYSEQDSSPSTDRDSSQDDSSDNSGAEPVTTKVNFFDKASDKLG